MDWDARVLEANIDTKRKEMIIKKNAENNLAPKPILIT